MLQITPMERFVLQLLASGHANEEIASRLVATEDHVEAHLADLFARLGASGRTHAVAIAARRGLLDSSSREAQREPTLSKAERYRMEA
jgi:DNA-binding CsgD family transcriptional regulator